MTSRLPHQWLRFGIPIALLVTTVILYQQEALAAALSDKLPDLTSTIVNNIYGTFHRLDTPIQKTIWRSVPHDEYLAVCLFARDQAADMVEWFQHHYFEMGIRRFYVMDDGSDPPLSTFMNDYGIPEEAVDFIHYEKSTDVPQGAQLYVVSKKIAHFHVLTNVLRTIVTYSSSFLAHISHGHWFCYAPLLYLGRRRSGTLTDCY